MKTALTNPVARSARFFLFATAVIAVAPAAAMADKAKVKRTENVQIIDQRGHGNASNNKVKTQHRTVTVVKKPTHRHSVGHRFNKKEVTVVSDWRARGLSKPGRNEVYVVNGDSIYLAAAASLLVKALIN